MAARPAMRGYSLPELLVALSIMSLLLFLGTANLRGSKPGVEVRGLAESVAESLRQARAQAMADHQPVAVVLPSGPFCQSLSLMTGQSNPRVTRVSDFRSEYPQSCIFVGTWAVDPSQLQDPAASPTIDPPLLGSLVPPLQPSSWIQPSRTDFMFVFTPAGTVVTNDLPNFDHSFHLLVADGLDSSASGPPPGTPRSAPPPPYYQATRACRPYTISVSVLGDVSVTPGVLASASFPLAQEPIPLGSSAGPAAVSSGANAIPVIQQVKIVSLTQSAMLPPGVNATVTADTHLTLIVEATDPDGDALTCDWSAKDSSGAEVHGFSSVQKESMDWDASAGVWRSTWQWRSPPTATTGSVYNLTATVQDVRGGVALTNNGAQQNIEFNAVGRILYIAPHTGTAWTNVDAFVVNGDGTGPRKILNNQPLTNRPCCFSPDGTKVAYTNASGIGLMNADGSVPRQLTYDGGGQPTFSPDGAQIYYAASGQTGILAIDADGSNRRIIRQVSGLNDCFPAVSPDGTRIAFVEYDAATYVDIFVMNSNGTGVSRVTYSVGSIWAIYPYWQPDGTQPDKIQYSILDVATNLSQVATINPNGTGRVILTSALSPGDYSGGGYSPDGTQIVFVDANPGGALYTMNADGTNIRQIRPGTSWAMSWAP